MTIYPEPDEFQEILNSWDDRDGIILRVHRSLRSVISSMIFFGLALIVVILINIYFRNVNLLGILPGNLYLSPRWLSIVPAGILIEICRKYHDDLYLFSLHTMTHHDGRLSLTYNRPNIRYVDIRAIVVNQNLLERLFDYGNITIDTAAQEKGEMQVAAVRAPDKLAGLVEILRVNSLKLAAHENAENAEHLGTE